MKRILINALPMTVVGTGIGRYLRGLANACERECRDTVALSYFVGDRIVELPPVVQGAGWQERMGQLLWKLPTPIAYGARLLRHFRTEKHFCELCEGFDVYHEAGYFPYIPQERIRTILTVHDLSLLRFPQWHPPERVRYANRYFRERLPLVDGFCAVSAFTKQEMVEHLGVAPEMITVTPLGVDPEQFNETPDPIAIQALDAFGLPDEFMLFVGSGDPRKNRELLVAALGAARTALPLVTVGWSGWSDDDLSGCVNMGYVSDATLAQLYRSAKMLVMPSEYEGFGLPVVEAMACGCPVLTSDAGALREVGGDAVEVVADIHDAKAFGACLDALFAEPEQLRGMSERGLALAARYTWTRTSLQTVATWQRG
ncbi:glycosyltransferase family 4 protein [Pseudodesulfovibrio sediminis]|uniref:Uncharacterized protein n=1 Tax=Pseudodesulfovibrio sediminis TaxID=2810563 RepID=A0ABN6EVE9_9BACT|nr:glycosyltransferase family 1 protein [Pseudodesulfovibrio sediminis]BCS89478.1 hypothetical protein PSDVSF_27200 [Pseudodesulfovibrio sediminis]